MIVLVISGSKVILSVANRGVWSELSSSMFAMSRSRLEIPVKKAKSKTWGIFVVSVGQYVGLTVIIINYTSVKLATLRID